MKTLEIINGQKVWAVDAALGCDGCMFKDNPITNTCFQCCDDERPDKRNVIFLLYEEEKEKTFTREEVIALCRSAHLHGEQGALNLHDGTFKEWIEENL